MHDGDHGTAATVDPLNVTAAAPLFPEQPQDQRGPGLHEEEWEIVTIVGKRRTRKSYKYKVRLKNIWLSRRELKNAQELLQDFEAQCRAQRGHKRGRPARAEKNGPPVAVPKRR